MTRSELLLAMLAAAQGRAYTPVQIQKAMFLADKNLRGIVNEGASYEFVPYDYGPFDAAVYSEAEGLKSSGMAEILPSGSGRWKTYAASEQGIRRGTEILDALHVSQSTYIRQVSDWVRGLSFNALVKSIYDAYPEMRAKSIFRG